MDARHRMRRFAGPSLAACLFLAAAGTAAARVFDRIGVSAADPWSVYSGWSRAFQAPLLLNGTETRLTLWSAPEPLSTVLTRMRDTARRVGREPFFNAGATMAWGRDPLADQTATWLATELEGGRQTLLFRFQADRPGAPADGRVAATLPPVPLPPGARPEFSAANRDSGMALAVCTVPGAPRETAAFLKRALGAAGWTPALGPSADPLGNLGVYVQPGTLCGFAVKKAGHLGGSTVTVWHRRLTTDVCD